MGRYKGDIGAFRSATSSAASASMTSAAPVCCRAPAPAPALAAAAAGASEIGAAACQSTRRARGARIRGGAQAGAPMALPWRSHDGPRLEWRSRSSSLSSSRSAPETVSRPAPRLALAAGARAASEARSRLRPTPSSSHLCRAPRMCSSAPAYARPRHPSPTPRRPPSPPRARRGLAWARELSTTAGVRHTCGDERCV